MSMAVAYETQKPVCEAARSVPSSRPGRTVSPGTLIRWIAKGAKLRGGGRLKLKATRSPGGWLTSEAWIQEFLSALTADRAGSVAPAPGAEARAAGAMARMRGRGFQCEPKG
jgi:hypothetical protein